MRPLQVTILAGLSALAVCTPISGVAAQGMPPEDARPLNAYELLQIYGDKTWKWGESGAAYMSTEERRLIAWYGEGDGFGYTRGRWLIRDDGELCLIANWQTKDGEFAKRSCFEHMIADETIYQKRVPDGDWYIFKHAEPQPTDEFNKLIPGDLASTVIDEMT